MLGRWLMVAALVAASQAALAAEVTVYGTLYGAADADFLEGELTPVISDPNAAETPVFGEVVTKDGDAAYNLAFEADVGVKATFNENVAANVLFTFDDSKQTDVYRYSLLEKLSAPGEYYLSQTRYNRYTYGSLEQVNVEIADAGAGVGVTLGGYDIRYGDGGYYNKLVNRIDAVSFIAYLDPFGARLTRGFGPVESSLAVGVGLSNQAVIATRQDLPKLGLSLYAAAEGMSYDLKTVWDGHMTASLPKTWRYFYQHEGILAETPQTRRGDVADTLHFGVSAKKELPYLDFCGTAAYHLYADDEAIAANPTGGTLMQFYPDLGVRVYWPRLWLRAAALYEVWRSNYHSTFGDGVGTTTYYLVYAEPQYFLTDQIMAGVWARYINPDTEAIDDPKTYFREDSTLSLAFGPHVVYAPTAGVKTDLTYSYQKWDPTLDDTISATREDVNKELKLEIEASF